ncbi:putative major facilitator superfamily domain containing protein 5 [Diaporthe ampelina]|uniref:Molybdate-anion transporter n=1 Tax=Diaporthe ampelina TaxID=1214573 RepID=A0A0G2HG36_9PEZI|nr:putative major facilitator superfamily domain containing protein 5 [Diaporthe ampelina]
MVVYQASIPCNCHNHAYLTGHLLAFAADWLQGPHLYAVYKYDKKLEETYVAALYATGFISAALSAAFVGQLADKFGRKRACLIYCASYTACCLSMLSDNLYILFAGKFCGGVSTTLLYSAFDAWMITEYHKRGLEAEHLSLATLYGWMTSLNSVVAITTGIVGEILVSLTGTKVSPFLLAVLVLGGTATWISSTWSENYGSQSNDMAKTSFFAVTATAIKEMWRDKRIFALTTAASLFESMMYLFVFFWSAALISARNVSGVTEDPPFGLIFASFMCCMMAGSVLFTTARSSHNITSASFTLKAAITFASASLLSAVLIGSHEYLVFWAFCLVELCVGMYFPSMNFLKSKIVEDDSRAKIYSFMRLPLSTLVVLAHSLAEEGDRHRNNVFLSFGGALLVAFIVTHRHLQ